MSRPVVRQAMSRLTLVGARGGSGVTSTAILLAALLADSHAGFHDLLVWLTGKPKRRL